MLVGCGTGQERRQQIFTVHFVACPFFSTSFCIGRQGRFSPDDFVLCGKSFGKKES